MKTGLSLIPVAFLNTALGVGADLWTTLGNFKMGDEGWQKTPFGKALREAAGKPTVEVAKRAK